MVTCPKCGHEYPIIAISTLPHWNSVKYWQDHYPDDDIPPYPTGITGDIMPTLRKCSCGKIFWTADNSRKTCGKCKK